MPFVIQPQAFLSFYQSGGWVLVDGAIWLLIFIGLARAVFEPRFKKRGGKAFYTGIGMALALSLLLVEFVTGFHMIALGPIATLILAIVLGYLIYALMLMIEDNKIIAATAAIIVGLLSLFALWGAILANQPLHPLLRNFGFTMELVMSLFELLLLVAFILFLIYLIVEVVKKMGGGQQPSPAGPPGGPTLAPGPTPGTQTTTPGTTPGTTPTTPAPGTTPTTPGTAPGSPTPAMPPGAGPIAPHIYPNPTVHHPWPRNSGKYSSAPPADPQCNDPVEITPPTTVRPSRFTNPENPIDLSNWFTQIKNQQQTSACAAFAGSAIIEYLHNTAVGLLDDEMDLSERFLWYEMRRNKNQNSGCYKADVITALTRHGACLEPFCFWEPTRNGVPDRFREIPEPAAYQDALNRVADTTRDLRADDPDSWVVALSNRNPIFIGINVYQNFMDVGNQQASTYYETSGALKGGHALVIVGWSNQYPDPTSNGLIQAFKVRNSWGSDWGENGYIWIPRDFLVSLLTREPFIISGLSEHDRTTIINDAGDTQPRHALPPGPDLNEILIRERRIFTGLQSMRRILIIARELNDPARTESERSTSKNIEAQSLAILRSVFQMHPVVPDQIQVAVEERNNLVTQIINASEGRVHLSISQYVADAPNVLVAEVEQAVTRTNEIIQWLQTQI